MPRPAAMASRHTLGKFSQRLGKTQISAFANNAGTVFSGVNKLLASGNTGLAENQAYYANFATVLANTRTPGVDTGTIYAFFSAPIDAKNVTPERASVASVASDPTGTLDPK